MTTREETVTSDLADFGSRERKMAGELLRAMSENNETHFLGEGVRVFMNRNSGYVFLSDEDYNTAMMDGDTLRDFLTSPYEGKEGFFDELLEEYEEMHNEDKRWLQDIAKSLGREDDIPADE